MQEITEKLEASASRPLILRTKLPQMSSSETR